MTGTLGTFYMRQEGGRAVALPTHSFDHYESIYDGIRWRVVLDHTSWHFYSALVDGDSPELPSFQYQIGIQGLSEDQSSPWFTAYLLKGSALLSPRNARNQMIGSDTTLRMKSVTRTQPWIMPFDVMIRTIASEYGLGADVEKADESRASKPVTYWQYGENDWDFLRRIAAQQRSLATGRGDYEVWLAGNNVLHVKPPGRVGPAVKRWGTGSLGRGLKRMRFVQRKRALQLLGGLAVQGYGFDMLTKTPTAVTKNYDNFPENTRLAPQVNLPTDARRPALTFRAIGDQGSLEQDAVNVIAERFRQQYLAEIEVMEDIQDYEVGDVVTLAIDQEGQPNPVFSGNWLVEQRHIFVRNRRVRVRLMASRVGSGTGRDRVPGRVMDIPAIERPAGRLRRITEIAG